MILHKSCALQWHSFYVFSPCQKRAEKSEGFEHMDENDRISAKLNEKMVL